MFINVTQEDISWARLHGAETPLVHVIQREVGGTWHMASNREAYEMVWPYRNALLSDEVADVLQAYRITGVIDPFQCELNLKSGQPYQAGAD